MADPQIRVITGLLAQATERVISRISVNVTAELIEATPVDTGWARANWVPAIGAPFIGPGTSMGNVTSQRQQQQSGVASVATSYKLSRGAVFVSNNVPYITRLNDGSSAQAPKAFVQAAINAAILKLGDTIPTVAT